MRPSEGLVFFKSLTLANHFPSKVAFKTTEKIQIKFCDVTRDSYAKFNKHKTLQGKCVHDLKQNTPKNLIF